MGNENLSAVESKDFCTYMYTIECPDYHMTRNRFMILDVSIFSES
jgi:hypothetical protein